MIRRRGGGAKKCEHAGQLSRKDLKKGLKSVSSWKYKENLWIIKILREDKKEKSSDCKVKVGMCWVVSKNESSPANVSQYQELAAISQRLTGTWRERERGGAYDRDGEARVNL